MTRTGEAILRASREATHPLRYCTVRCGLNPKRNAKQPPRLQHPALQAVFQSTASRIGIYRHVVTLIANQLVRTDPSIANCGWKTFYDRTWSAVDAVAAGKVVSNELHEAVTRILSKTPIKLPDKILFDLRQQETSQLETHTIEHLETFPDRLVHVMRVRVAEAAPHLKWTDVDVLGKHAANYALSCPTYLEKAEAKLRACGDGAEIAFAFACTERVALGNLVNANRRGRPFIKQFNKGTIHALLPHVMRLSLWSERWLDEHFSTEKDGQSKTVSATEDEVQHTTTCTRDDLSIVVEVRRWSRSRLPKPCTALPIAQLKASMVLYTCTEVETMLKNLHTTVRRKKRPLDEEERTPIDWPDAKLDKANFAAAVFNLESFKGRRGNVTLEDGTSAPKWRIASFRTDGVALTVTFVSGHMPVAFNADMLMQRGYKLTEPEAPVDPSTTKRGLYFVGERRCDLASSASTVRATVVDPGFCKPVHVASVRSDSSVPFAEASHWHLTEEEWMYSSGRLRNQETEKRRREGTQYGEALDSLVGVGRRKSVTKAFVEYSEAMFHTLATRAAELISVARSAARWQQKRCLTRFIGRLCDRLFDRTSTRPGKNIPSLDESTREEYRARLMEMRRQQKETPTVVFFGDASYGPTMRGHNAIPKKGILRELCHRGLTVLLDEFRTSKMCPCGHDELKTMGDRLRAHKSDGAACSLLAQLGEKACDRDALASLNMVSCALCSLDGRGRPGHLCRTRFSNCEH